MSASPLSLVQSPHFFVLVEQFREILYIRLLAQTYTLFIPHFSKSRVTQKEIAHLVLRFVFNTLAECPREEGGDPVSARTRRLFLACNLPAISSSFPRMRMPTILGWWTSSCSCGPKPSPRCGSFNLTLPTNSWHP